MGEELNWRLIVADAISGPAREMATSLRSVSDSLKEVSRQLDDFSKEAKNAAKETKSLGESAFEFENIKHAAESMVEPLLRLGEFSLDKVFEFEKAGVEALSFKEKTLSSLEALLGSGKEAQAFFAQASFIGKVTPYQTKDVVDQFQRLLSDGFSKTEVPIVFQALGDAAALKGYDVNTMNNMGRALGHVMSMGFNERGIQMFSADAAGTGFSKDKLLMNLEKKMGLTKEGVLAAISGGKIGAREGVNAILDVIRDTAGGGTIGGGMKLHQDTFEGIASTLKSTFSAAFMTQEGLPTAIEGYKTLKDVMINMRTAVDSATPSGKMFSDALVYAFNAVDRALGPLTGPEGLTNMRALLADVSTAVKVFGNVVDLAFTTGMGVMEGFLKGMGLLDEKGSGAFDDFLDPEKFKLLEDSAKEFGKELGTSLSDIAKAARELMQVYDTLMGQKDTLSFMKNVVEVAGDLTPGVGLAKNAFALDRAAHQKGGFGDDLMAQMDMGPKGGADLAKTPGGAKGGAAGGSHTFSTVININGAEAKDTKELAAEVSKAQSYSYEEMLRKLGTQSGSM